MNAPTIDSFYRHYARYNFNKTPKINEIDEKLAPATKMAVMRQNPDYIDSELMQFVSQFVMEYGLEQYLTDYPIGECCSHCGKHVRFGYDVDETDVNFIIDEADDEEPRSYCLVGRIWKSMQKVRTNPVFIQIIEHANSMVDFFDRYDGKWKIVLIPTVVVPYIHIIQREYGETYSAQAGRYIENQVLSFKKMDGNISNSVALEVLQTQVIDPVAIIEMVFICEYFNDRRGRLKREKMVDYSKKYDARGFKIKKYFCRKQA
jgi:hypothetical protein